MGTRTAQDFTVVDIGAVETENEMSVYVGSMMASWNSHRVSEYRFSGYICIVTLQGHDEREPSVKRHPIKRTGNDGK